MKKNIQLESNTRASNIQATKERTMPDQQKMHPTKERTMPDQQKMHHLGNLL